MTTTFETIRNNQCSVIEALTPTKLAGQKFRRHLEGDFMTWVEASPAACLRRFQIERNFDDEQLPTADGAIEGCRHTMELRIAYPLNHALYGRENVRDLNDFMDADRRQIDAAIGLNGAANYVANEDVCQFTAMTVLEAGEGAKVLSITFSLLYDRSV